MHRSGLPASNCKLEDMFRADLAFNKKIFGRFWSHEQRIFLLDGECDTIFSSGAWWARIFFRAHTMNGPNGLLKPLKPISPLKLQTLGKLLLSHSVVAAAGPLRRSASPKGWIFPLLSVTIIQLDSVHLQNSVLDVKIESFLVFFLFLKQVSGGLFSEGDRKWGFYWLLFVIC